MTDTTIAHDANPPFMVCPGCDGHGTRANPAFDGMPVHPDAFDGDYEDMREFMSEYTTRGGMYDVACWECNGKRVVPQPCACRRCEDDRQEIADMEAMERAERAFGC